MTLKTGVDIVPTLLLRWVVVWFSNTEPVSVRTPTLIGDTCPVTSYVPTTLPIYVHCPNSSVGRGSGQLRSLRSREGKINHTYYGRWGSNETTQGPQTDLLVSSFPLGPGTLGVRYTSAGGVGFSPGRLTARHRPFSRTIKTTFFKLNEVDSD